MGITPSRGRRWGGPVSGADDTPEDDEIVYASDLPLCPDCEEPWCPKHEMHYADCPCKGPHSEDDDG